MIEAIDFIDEFDTEEDKTIKWLEDGEDRAELEILINRDQIDVAAAKFEGSPILDEIIASTIKRVK